MKVGAWRRCGVKARLRVEKLGRVRKGLGLGFGVGREVASLEEICVPS